MRLVIAARKSDLARIQAYTVGSELKKYHPHLQLEFHFRESLGDKNAHDPLWKMPERGVFTEDFHQGLLQGAFDLVVHSWKDLPVQERQGSLLAATLPREDARDLLLVKKTSLVARSQWKILSSSPRREYNLKRCLPDLLPQARDAEIVFHPIRGNIPTRLKKLMDSDCDGLVVAKAAMDRMLAVPTLQFKKDFDDDFSQVQNQICEVLEQCQWMVLPLQLNPSAAAQGALAIEIRQGREDLQKLLAPLHCSTTYECVQEERERLKSWGGGCHQKIGVSVFKRDYGKVILVQGLTETGSELNIFEFQSTEPPNNSSKKDYFPHEPSQQLWFERQTKPVTSLWKTCNAHYVSKSEALPESIKLPPTSLVWTSGVATWKSLAQRGIWVHGTSESLGEEEPKKLGVLERAPRRWCKWTHASGEKSLDGVVEESYELIPLKSVPVLNPHTEHFYWMSGSSFEQAIQTYPWLLDKTHWCGPGHSLQRIQKILDSRKSQGAVRVALNFNQWQKMMTS